MTIKILLLALLPTLVIVSGCDDDVYTPDVEDADSRMLCLAGDLVCDDDDICELIPPPCPVDFIWSLDACDCVEVPQCKPGCFYDGTGCVCGGVGQSCGPSICAFGLTCCNESCGWCVPPGVECLQVVCDYPF